MTDLNQHFLRHYHVHLRLRDLPYRHPTDWHGYAAQTFHEYITHWPPTNRTTGFSLFGQFAASLILLQTAPIGFVTVGWRYYLVIILCSLVFIPIIYFYFPETARLSLEEISAKFGDEVAVDLRDISEVERKELDNAVRIEVSEGATVRSV
jgi:hypothetical protein